MQNILYVTKLQAALKAELARVYFEEFARFGFDFWTIIISTKCFFLEVKTMKWIGRRGVGVVTTTTTTTMTILSDAPTQHAHPYYYQPVTGEEVTSKSRCAVCSGVRGGIDRVPAQGAKPR